MLLPPARGPVSDWCRAWLQGDPQVQGSPLDQIEPDVLGDDDTQLGLWMLYELHYQGFEGVEAGLEWEPALLALRRELERRLETQLRERTQDRMDEHATHSTDVAETIFALCATDESPSLADFAKTSASREQLLEILMHRSVYQLKEADPYTWMVPRLRGRAKTALLDILYDEYGCGRPEDVHATLFAQTLEACDLDSSYGAYVENAPAPTLAVSNTASMFGLQRRLRGAAAGHFAVVEATSSLPSRQMSAALARHDFGPRASRFYDEHIEADAVHEQLAARGLCGALLEDHPELRDDVVFGAAACQLVEGLFAEEVLAAWADGRPSTYPPHSEDADVAVSP